MFICKYSRPVGGVFGMLTAAPELRLGFLIEAGGERTAAAKRFFFFFLHCLQVVLIRWTHTVEQQSGLAD